MGEEPATLAGKALSLVLTNGAKAQQTSLTIGADLAPTSTVSLWKMLLFALIGGLILNLMPCVLPVMGMKLSAVLQSGSDKRAIGRRFLATSAGILTSFALLALMVTILKLTGASLGLGDPSSRTLVYRLNDCRYVYLFAQPVWRLRGAATVISR